MKSVPLYKVPKINSSLLEQTLESGWIGQGPRVEEFEKALEEYLGTKYLLTTNSCTSALHLAMRLVRRKSEYYINGQRKTEEAITTPFTCVAVSCAIADAGYARRWCDIDPYSYNIDIDKLELRENTRAVIVPHFCGDPIDLNHLYNILRKHHNSTGKRVYVIEDCASAFGGVFKGDKIGAHHKDINYPHENSIKCFSFGAVKTLTTGDGGAIVLPNNKLYERAKRLRWYNLDRDKDRYSQNHGNSGFKFHMNDVAASIGLAVMENIDETVNRQIENRAYYHKELKLASPILFPGRISACGQFPLHVKNRDAFIEFMAERGVETKQPHTRLDKSSMISCPLIVLDRFWEEVVCIPSGWWVNDEDREHIAKSVKEWHGW